MQWLLEKARAFTENLSEVVQLIAPAQSCCTHVQTVQEANIMSAAFHTMQANIQLAIAHQLPTISAVGPCHIQFQLQLTSNCS